MICVTCGFEKREHGRRYGDVGRHSGLVDSVQSNSLWQREYRVSLSLYEIDIGLDHLQFPFLWAACFEPLAKDNGLAAKVVTIEFHSGIH